MIWEQWVSIAALVLALAAVVVGLVVLRRLAEARQNAKPLAKPREREGDGAGPPAFVINPIKVPDKEALRRLANDAATRLGLDPPLWFETTERDPGKGQARLAVEQGASVVVAAGGDGTVRAVADALAGSHVPMGLIPMGTGNLLARNLDLPLGDTRGLVQVALSGRDHSIDVGYLRIEANDGGDADGGRAGGETGGGGAVRATAGGDTGDGDKGGDDADGGGVFGGGTVVGQEHPFLVMAGLGFDAAMVAGADDEMKKRMGWFAYFVVGVRHMHGRRVRVKMKIGDSPTQSLRLRSILFANCGRLPGGIVLFPDAELDDGWIDIAGIDTKGGVVGWASLFGKVILQGLGIRRDLRASPGTIEFWRGREIHVATETPEPVQVDGDLVGSATLVSVTLRAGALDVRTR